MARFLFRLDAGPRIGTGHAMRCLALLEAARDAGHSGLVASAEMTDPVANRFSAEDTQVYRLRASRGSSSDARETLALADRQDVDLIVADPFSDMSPGWFAGLAGELPVALFTDVGPVEEAALPAKVRVLINPARRDAGEAGRICLYGPDYLLLRRSFRSMLAPSPLDGRTRLLVTFGGTDPAELTAPVVRGLKAAGEAMPGLDVVIGGGVAQARRVAQACEGPGVAIHHDLDSLAPLMARAGLAVTAGGSTVGELAAVGVPAVVVAVAENQRAGVKAAFRDGWTVACDVADHKPAEIADIAMDLWRDLPRRQAMAAQTQGLVNRRGAEAVLTELLELI